MSMDAARPHLAAAAAAMRVGAIGTSRNALQSALALTPDDADAWFNLGWVERAAHNSGAALKAYAEAIRLGVARPEEAHINRAVILNEQLGDADAALSEIDRALLIAPDFAAAWLNRGLIEEDRGNVAGARDAYAHLLALQPGHGRALARSAALDLVDGEGAAALARLAAALPDARDAEARADILFALGDAHDAAGDYDAAFAAYEQANRLAAALQPARYSRQAQQALADRLLAMPAMHMAGDPAPARPSPIFICGMFRSGSTLVEQLLARHPALVAMGEREQIPLLARQITPYPDGVAALSDETLAAMRAHYRHDLPTDRRAIDKRCDNVWHIPLILRLFPDATIINTRRHPLDNLLSVYFLHFGEAVSYSSSLDDAAHYLAQVERVMAAMKARYPGRIIDCDYDALVTAPQATLEPVLTALRLAWDDACLQPSTARSVRTASAWQVRKPLHARSSGRWRHYARHVEKLREMLDEQGLL